MAKDNKRVTLDELSRRWQKTPDQILALAAEGTLTLWYEFENVIVHKIKKKKTPEPKLHETIEIQLPMKTVEMIIGRTDRIQVASEYTCLTPKGKQVLISNAAGEEWGDTSMVGLNPLRIYALEKDLPKIEKKQDIVPFTEEVASSCCCQSSGSCDDNDDDDDDLFADDHPCYAPELNIALECWFELMSEEDDPESILKTDIRDWVQSNYPELTKTATERIVMVVTPAAKQQR